MSVVGILKAELDALERDRKKIERLLGMANKLESSGWSLVTNKFILNYLHDNKLCVLRKDTICEMRDAFVFAYPHELNGSEDEWELLKRSHYDYYIERLEESLKGGLPTQEILE